MFKTTLTAVALVAALAATPAVAHAVTVDQACQQAITPYQQAGCSSPRVRAIMQTNLDLATQILARLDDPGRRQFVAQELEGQRNYGIACGIAPDHPPQLPMSAQTENCVVGFAQQKTARYQQWTAANGSAPVQPGSVQPGAQSYGSASDPRYGDCLRLRYGILAGLHRGEICTPEMAAQAQAQLNFNAAQNQRRLESLVRPGPVIVEQPIAPQNCNYVASPNGGGFTLYNFGCQ